MVVNLTFDLVPPEMVLMTRELEIKPRVEGANRT
jgi:hypothetical protein